MAGFTVSEWKRYGKDRLYIADGAGAKVGYYDRQTSKLHVEDPDLEYAALEALAPFLGGEIPALGHSVQAAPPPANLDLANNAAGAAVANKAAELSPGRFQRLASRLLGIRTEASTWEAGATGERIVGGRLDRLKSRGWGVLHSVPLKSGSDIDHVVVGPGGVFTVNTKHHADARVKADRDFIRVNGHLQPYVRNSKHEAASASRRLSAACGRQVNVTGVIAFVGVASLIVRAVPVGLMIVPGKEIDQYLLATPPVLSESEQRAVFAIARRPEIWLA